MRITHKTPATPMNLRELAERHKTQGLDPIVENGVVYEPIVAKTLLTRGTGPGLRHYWSINPYRGCQFGCVYCYARYTAGFIEIKDPLQFERRIFYKQNAPTLARRLRDADFYGRPVALGTATDPWQPAEGRLCITRGILEGLARYPSLDLFCVTKSSLVRRDADLLGKLAAAGRPVGVGISIATIDADLAKRMEPQAALPRERLNAMRALTEAGIYTGVMVMPILPGLTDASEQLEAVLAAAKAHGARFAHENVLHLRDAPKRRFMPWLEAEFPHLAAEYHAVYDGAARPRENYRHSIARSFAELRRRVGIGEQDYRPPPRGRQLKLL